MRRIFRDQGFSADRMNHPQIRALIEATTDVYSAAVSPVLKSGVIPDVMAKHLREDLFVFSGFKTYNELRDVASLLLDKDGTMKSFNKFYSDIESIKEDYNRHWLESEYIFAQASSEMAAKWADYEQDGDEYDLQYRTANDGKVRPEHAVLHNVTLPPSDPFWEEFFPPNGWRCRCSAVQVRKGKYPRSDSNTAIRQGREATYQAGKNGVNKAAIFRYNPGKQQVIFPPHHPYYEVSERERKAVMEAIFQEIPNHSVRTKELKKEAKKLVGQSFLNDGFEKTITISVKGIKEWLNQPHEHYMEKNELLLDIASLIRGATYKGAGKDKHDPNIILHLFEVKIKGDKSWIIVREHPSGIASIHSISDSPGILNALNK